MGDKTSPTDWRTFSSAYIYIYILVIFKTLYPGAQLDYWGLSTRLGRLGSAPRGAISPVNPLVEGRGK